MVYNLRFFFSSSKCSLFHNSNVFGSCIIHILYTGCAKIKNNNSGAKKLIGLRVGWQWNWFQYFSTLHPKTFPQNPKLENFHCPSKWLRALHKQTTNSKKKQSYLSLQCLTTLHCMLLSTAHLKQYGTTQKFPNWSWYYDWPRKCKVFPLIMTFMGVCFSYQLCQYYELKLTRFSTE